MRFSHLVTAVMAALTVGFIAYLCAFKVMDRDFWWHVTAGGRMLATHSLIKTDPFAYTRAGQPYLATHEWLAQIVLYAVFHLAGSTGVILFRTAMVLVTFALLLGIDRRRLWPNAFLAIYGAVVARAGYLERPQLFTYALFAAVLALACRFLEERREGNAVKERRLLGLFVVLQIFWVNLHGAACVLGYVVFGALWIQVLLAEGWRGRPDLLWRNERVRPLTLTLFALAAAFFVCPNTYHNLAYLKDLFTDRTVAFIGEWQPSPAAAYWKAMGPLWAAAVLALCLGGRGRLFSALILLATGVLSRQALRHEMIFVFAATGLTFFQLKTSDRYARWWEGAARRPLVPAFASIGLLALLAFHTRAKALDFLVGDRTFQGGYGTFDLARGATDFLQRERIPGPVFNTYGIGGYLMYRGVPVFIDGRNVDFGFDFLEQTFVAGTEPALWRALQQKYGFTCALIDYDAIQRSNGIPYAQHLDRNPDWALVYLDDWVAVYLKDVPENRDVIRRCRYAVVNPERLESESWWSAIDPATAAAVEPELRRMIADNPDGVKARLALGRFALSRGDLDAARRFSSEALAREAAKPEAIQLAAALAVSDQRWLDAGRLYEKAIRLGGEAYSNVNYRFIGDVFQKAGRMRTARAYWKKADAQRASGSPAMPSAGLPQAITAPPVKAAEPMGRLVETIKGASIRRSPTEADVRLAQALTKSINQEKTVHNERGVEWARKKEWERARGEFEQALTLDPGYPEANNNLGGVYYSEKRYAEAIVYYRKALERNSNYADAHHNLVMAYVRTGDFERARRHAEEAARLGRPLDPRWLGVIAQGAKR